MGCIYGLKVHVRVYLYIEYILYMYTLTYVYVYTYVHTYGIPKRLLYYTFASWNGVGRPGCADLDGGSHRIALSWCSPLTLRLRCQAQDAEARTQRDWWTYRPLSTSDIWYHHDRAFGCYGREFFRPKLSNVYQAVDRLAAAADFGHPAFLQGSSWSSLGTCR